ncbi:MAG: helix-turn-helix domain-containing protein [Verrucomicrobiota bacterium]|jgi:transcriptional regulator with PAS, ATPase and Fis domain|nr:helix-turn-helix domain-containing protein [Verrucomicrobiota bacterium]
MDSQYRIEGVIRPQDAAKTVYMMVDLDPADGLDTALEKFERQMIQNALRRNESNVTTTAKELKMTRHALSYRRKKLGL